MHRFRYKLPLLALAAVLLPRLAAAQACDARQDFLYGSVCGSMTVTPFNPRPGDTVTVVFQGGCTSAPRRLTVSGALAAATLDGVPVTGTAGAAGAYSGWDPQPVPDASRGIPIPGDALSHTAVFTIDPAAQPSCVKVSGSSAPGPWVEFMGSDSGGWFLAKPLRIQAAPTIASTSPTSGPVAGGTSVVITGTYFTGGTVTFGGTSAVCTVNTSTQITCTAPAHAAGAADVVVTTVDGTATSTGGFTYAATPSITSLTPSIGPPAGGTSVVISGTGLTGGTVTFGGTSAVCTVNSSVQITCTAPAHAAGAVDVVVTTAGGSSTSAGGYTYGVVPAPTIGSLAPSSGPLGGGTSVVITGTNLTGGTVTFGGTGATCTVNAATQITCTAPAHAAGAVDVVVTTAGGTSSSVGGFTFIASVPTMPLWGWLIMAGLMAAMGVRSLRRREA